MSRSMSRTTGRIARAGLSQIALRALALGLFVAALLRIGQGPAWPWVGLLVASVAIHALWPAPPRAPGMLAMRRGPSVVGPDLIGTLLAGLFLALPVWIGRGEGSTGLHGSAWMLWPMAMGGIALLGIAAANACFRLEIGDAGLRLGRLGGDREIPWQAITGVRRWRRGLPRGLRALVPFLPPRPAGAVLLARDSTGLELDLAGGGRLRLPREGFEQGEAMLLRALAKRKLRPAA